LITIFWSESVRVCSKQYHYLMIRICTSLLETVSLSCDQNLYEFTRNNITILWSESVRVCSKQYHYLVIRICTSSLETISLSCDQNLYEFARNNIIFCGIAQLVIVMCKDTLFFYGSSPYENGYSYIVTTPRLVSFIFYSWKLCVNFMIHLYFYFLLLFHKLFLTLYRRRNK